MAGASGPVGHQAAGPAGCGRQGLEPGDVWAGLNVSAVGRSMVTGPGPHELTKASWALSAPLLGGDRPEPDSPRESLQRPFLPPWHSGPSAGGCPAQQVPAPCLASVPAPQGSELCFLGAHGLFSVNLCRQDCPRGRPVLIYRSPPAPQDASAWGLGST